MKNLYHLFKRKFRTLRNKPELLIIKNLYRISPIFPDIIYLRILFRLSVGYPLELESPRTYNAKLQWLKLYYRKNLMIRMVDKFKAKEFITEVVGCRYVVKSYGVWDHFDDIDLSKLPDSFVLKTTHDQGGVCIVRDKSEFDIESIRKSFERRLKKNHFWLSREWPYKNVKPRIMAEELLIDDNQSDLADYKFYCFDGKPKVMYIAQGRQEGHCTFDFFDVNFNKLDIKRPNYPNTEGDISKPKLWDEMIEVSQKLSEGLPHLRVDFYISNDRLFVGELTFFQGGGMMPFEPEAWDYIMGDYIILPKNHKIE